jgi:hypothetical protein
MTKQPFSTKFRRRVWLGGMTTQILHEAVCKARVNIRALRYRGRDVYFDGDLIATMEVDEDYRFRVIYSGLANWSELEMPEVSSWYCEDDRSMLGLLILVRVLILCIQTNKITQNIEHMGGVCIA